jgi:alpha-1,2-mannosyltransferase
MTSVLLAMALFLDNRTRLSLVVASFAVLLCWPFCILMFVPMGVAALFTLGVLSVCAVAAGSIALFLLVPSALDSVLYYQKPVFPVANIVLYNAMGDSNAELYGTEPWYFYVVNLALNLNIVAPLAVVSLPLWAIARACKQVRSRPSDEMQLPTKRDGFILTVVCFAPLYVSLAFFSAQPHKEERFLFPVYPIICLAASIAVQSVARILARVASVTGIGASPEANTSGVRCMLNISVVAPSTALSLSRIVAVSTAFAAPLQAFAHLSAHAELPALVRIAHAEGSGSSKLVCLGSEWHRFPTSFLLPESHVVGFIDSGFGGLLPQQFPDWPTGTSSAPEGLNGDNKPNPSALRQLSECNYFVGMGSDTWKVVNRTMEHEEELLADKRRAVAAVGQPGWDEKQVWAQLKCWPFLNVEHSRSPWRSFALPAWLVPQEALDFEPYCLFERRTVSIAD